MEKQNPWKTISKKFVYENPWIRLDEHKVINPGGGQGRYGVLHFKHLAIGVIPMDEKGNIWLVGQYRYVLDEYSWEIPEGGGELDTDPEESAKRELLEETGIKAEKWEILQELYLSNSVTDEYGIIYLARDLSFHPPEPTEEEELEIKKIPFDQAFEMILKGDIKDSLSIVGMLKLKYLFNTGF